MMEKLWRGSEWCLLLRFNDLRHSFYIVVASVLTLFSGLLDPLIARVLGLLFEHFTQYSSGRLSATEFKAEVSSNLLGLLALGISSFMLNGSFFASWVGFGERQLAAARIGVFERLIRHTIERFEQQDGEMTSLSSRIQSQLRDFAAGSSQSLGFVLQATVSTLAALTLAVFMAWDVTCITLSMTPFAAILLAWLSRQTQSLVNLQNDEMDRAIRTATCAINAVDTVKVFNTYDVEFHKYQSAVKRCGIYYLKYARLNAIQIGLVRLVTLGMFVQGFWYGIRAFSLGHRTADQILTAFWACLVATQSVEHITSRMTVLDQGKAAAKSLKRIRAVTPISHPRYGIREGPQTISGNISLEAVSFAYRKAQQSQTLTDLNMHFPSGEFSFILGENGSGKSTIANLLLRFYEPNSGRVLLDATPLEELDESWLRNRITLASHDPDIFEDSILENVILAANGERAFTYGDVREAFEFSGLSGVMQNLPRGWNTKLGRSGDQLSGGERQRLGLSRARLRDTPVLILDEAISALDAGARVQLMRKVRQWRRGKTTIIITHDAAQIEDVDYVYHIHNGRVVREGYWSVLAFEMKTWCTFADMKSYTDLPILTFPNRNCDNQADCAFEKQSVPYGEISTFRYPRTAHERRYLEDMSLTSLPQLEFSDLQISMLPVRLLPPSPTTSFPMTRSLEASAQTIIQPSRTDFEGHDYQIHSPESFESLLGKGNHSCPEEDLYVTFDEPRSLGTRLKQKPYAVLSVWNIFGTVWPGLDSNERKRLGFGFLAAAIHSLATPAFAFAFARLLVAFELPMENRWWHATVWTTIILGVAITDSLASYVMHYYLDSVGQTWVDGIRLEAFKRILIQPRAWFDLAGNNVDDLALCLDERAEEMRNLVRRLAAFGFVALCMVCIAFIWSIVICWRLAGVGILAAPLLYLLSRIFEHSSQMWEAKTDDATLSSAIVFSEALSKIKTVKLFGLESWFLQKYRHTVQEALRIGSRRAVFSGLFVGAMDASMMATQALVFWYGSILVTSHGIAVSNVIAVFSVLLFSLASAGMILSMIPQISSAQVAASRLLALAALPKDYASANKTHLSELTGPILLRNFNLDHPTRPLSILKSLSLTVCLGRSVGLVGLSGSGKTTILCVLLGLYPGQSLDNSALTVGGLPISQIYLPSLYAHIGYLSRRIAIFPDTIAKNITYGLDRQSFQTSSESVENAARLAGIDTFIRSLPEGYSTRIGEGNLGLSTGQIQRIGIARALVRQPKLLIMDEPTSNLDAEATAQIRECIQLLVHEGTTVVVATHSVEMMRSMDDLVVIEAGQATEAGSWNALIGQDGSRLRAVLRDTATDCKSKHLPLACETG